MKVKALTGAIIQARTASTRLPAKILKNLPYGSGVSVLEQVIRRLKRAASLDRIIVATTENPEDDAIVELARKENVPYFRGPEKDVLARYYQAAKENGLEVIVRVTSDCPCIDPEVVDLVVKDISESGADYASNSLKRTYPHGLDTEVFTMAALERSFKEAKKKFEREHVTPYIYMTGQFQIRNVEVPEEFFAPEIRITLDTMEDYALLCAVYDYLYPGNPLFGVSEIVKLFKVKPWLKFINGKVVQKKIFGGLTEELEETVKILDLQDLKRARDFIRERIADFNEGRTAP
ncbi:MAG: glycosyltransferase family protein [Nitrospiraceae bacterium]|nr:glycosyltransferase family protein [Nitrospiraceae bacterium]